jgi:hypothetical protein
MQPRANFTALGALIYTGRIAERTASCYMLLTSTVNPFRFQLLRDRHRELKNSLLGILVLRLKGASIEKSDYR